MAGTAALPSDVQDFGVSVVGDSAHLRWQAVGDADLSHYAVRHSPATEDAAWANAVDVALSIPYDATSIVLPAVSGSYLIKAVDVGGRYSANAAVAVSPVAGTLTGNLVVDIDESASFSGDKTDITRIDGQLRLECIGSVDDEADFDINTG